MTDSKKCCDKSTSEKSSGCCGGVKLVLLCGGGAKLVILPLILVAVAIGVYVYISKNAGDKQPQAAETAKVESDAETPKNTNPVLAKIDGEEIKRLDVLNIINSMPEQMRQIPIDQLFPMALEQLVNNKIIDKKTSESDLEENEEVIEKLEKAKDNIIRAKFIEDAINDKLTEERVKAKYDEYVKSFPKVEEVRASHILVEDDKQAKDIIQKLNKGAKFAELAKENSKDGSSENGGDLGYFTKDDVVPEFAEAAFATKVGEYTKTPVKSDFGFHIIKIEEKRIRPPAEFSQIKSYIEQELRRSIIGEILEEFKVGVNIELFDINGNPLPSENAPEKTAPAAGEESKDNVEDQIADKEMSDDK